MRLSIHAALIAAVLASAVLTPVAFARGESRAAAPDCRIGAYRLDDGRIVDVGPSSAGLRWRMPDGTTGVLQPAAEPGVFRSTLGSTGRPDGRAIAFGPCGSGELRFDGATGRLLTFDVVETRFRSGGATLFGRLVLPPGTGPAPLVVQVHGSERFSATEFNPRQRMLPAFGIGAFVYDKRGTGRSGGRYTQDFAVLAADAAAAAREARRLAAERAGVLAYEGASQGGWVAPLAALAEPADRVIVGYGLTVSPLEENRSEVLNALKAEGFDATALAGAAEVADATGELMASGFRRGFERYARARARYRREPWYGRLGGEFTGDLSRYPAWVLRLAGPVLHRFIDRGTPWRHEPLPVLRRVQAPMLWVVAGADREAPPEQTLADLRALQAEGRDVTVLVFPNTDHGVVEFETAPDRERVATRTADGYFAAVVDFARDGRLGEGAYGASVRSGPGPRVSPPAP
jgi:dienelactone hydrolase